MWIRAELVFLTRKIGEKPGLLTDLFTEALFLVRKQKEKQKEKEKEKGKEERQSPLNRITNSRFPYLCRPKFGN
jgi:hypothetical protein